MYLNHHLSITMDVKISNIQDKIEIYYQDLDTFLLVRSGTLTGTEQDSSQSFSLSEGDILFIPATKKFALTPFTENVVFYFQISSN